MNTDRAAAALLCLLGLAGCGEKKEAHLERFLQPGQEPAKSSPPALDPFALTDNNEMADRINGLGFSETSTLLGAHRYLAKVKFVFRSDQSYVSLLEDDEIVVAQNGDLSIKVENDAGQGFRAIYAGGEFWVQNRYSPFHPRSSLAGEHLKLAEQAFGGWAAVYRLYRGRLAFTKLGLSRLAGREAVKYSVRLSQQAPRFSARLPQPEPPAGVSKYLYPVESTPSDRDGWRDRARPLRAVGMLWLDVATGVIIGADLVGGFQVEHGEGGKKLELEIEASIRIDNFGKPAALSPPPPDQVTPMPERIPVDTHPLDFFFGKGFTSTLGPPAGVAAKPKGEDKN